MEDFDKKYGFQGALSNKAGYKKLSLNERREFLEGYKKPAGVGEFKLAVIEGKQSDKYLINLIEEDKLKRGYVTFSSMNWAKKHRRKDNKNRFYYKDIADVLKIGDIVLIAKDNAENQYSLAQIPEVNGALIAIENHTGRVLASVGGYSFERSKFNRAFQARRQPGSAFKSFIFLKAFEMGYSPADLIADEPLELLKSLPQNNFENNYIYNREEDVWQPQNYHGKFYGTTSLRKGMEQSINVMTVHLAKIIGIDAIIEIANRFDIPTAIQRDFSTALGALSTTPARITAAYASIANGGKQVKPHLIERVQDKTGKTIYQTDKRECEYCDLTNYSKEAILAEPKKFFPKVYSNKANLSDEESVYQITSVMQGVVERGTAKAARKLGKPVAGKTGTTNLSKDAWFVGFSPDISTGVYVGFDKPRPMGRAFTGSTLALPIFIDFMAEALKEIPAKPFKIPPSTELVRTDINTGMLPSYKTASEDIIMEVFKDGQSPKRALIEGEMPRVINSPKLGEGRHQDVIDIPITRGTGGIY